MSVRRLCRRSWPGIQSVDFERSDAETRDQMYLYFEVRGRTVENYLIIFKNVRKNIEKFSKNAFEVKFVMKCQKKATLK